MEARDYVSKLLSSGLTQSEIAERTGIPQPTISKVYRGEIDDVRSRAYRKLQDLHNKIARSRRQPAKAA